MFWRFSLLKNIKFGRSCNELSKNYKHETMSGLSENRCIKYISTFRIRALNGLKEESDSSKIMEKIPALAYMSFRIIV